MTDQQLYKLCRRFGEFTSLEWMADWAAVSPAQVQKAMSREAGRFVLILGSFHPNGYFREKCVYAMEGYRGCCSGFSCE